MNIGANAVDLVLESILAICAFLSALWPSRALYFFYRSRQAAESKLRVRFFRILSAVAFTGLLMAIVSKLMETKR